MRNVVTGYAGQKIAIEHELMELRRKSFRSPLIFYNVEWGGFERNYFCVRSEEKSCEYVIVVSCCSLEEKERHKREKSMYDSITLIFHGSKSSLKGSRVGIPYQKAR